MNNCKNNTVRCLKQPALCKSARGCELPACIYDALGTTVGSKSNGKYSAAALTAFGENHLTTEPPNHQTFFTGKPYVEGLGHAFWMRNYRAGLSKWQSAVPMGYPDGWNALAYCGNGVTSAVDLWGCARYDIPENVEEVFRNYAAACAAQGNTGLLDDITKRSRNEADTCGKPVVTHELGFDIVRETTNWTRTGRKKWNVNGYWLYEEERIHYTYIYDYYLLLMKCEYDTNWFYKAAGVGLGIAGAAVGVKYLGLAWYWGVGIGAGGVVWEFGDWIMSDYDYVPIGVIFKKRSETSWKEQRWVE